MKCPHCNGYISIAETLEVSVEDQRAAINYYQSKGQSISYLGDGLYKVTYHKQKRDGHPMIEYRLGWTLTNNYIKEVSNGAENSEGIRERGDITNTRVSIRRKQRGQEESEVVKNGGTEESDKPRKRGRPKGSKNKVKY